METKVSKATGANISLTGYVGTMTAKEKPDGKVTTFLRLATHRRIYTEDTKEDKTDWHNAVAYGNIAKVIRDYVKKGDSIIINGELENWEFDEDSGEKLEKKYIKINKMQFKSDCYAQLIGFIGSVFREGEDSPLYMKVSNIRKIKNSDGELEDKTDWHTVVFYGKLSEIMEEYAQKGQKISIHGSLEVVDGEKEDSKGFKEEINYIRAYNAKFL
jgi:single-stranded DNA-binding protein